MAPPSRIVALALLGPAVASSLVGCGGDSGDTALELPVDEDGDGYTVETDCNDRDDTVFPTAPERCDGIDNDCDGAADESDAVDATTWYLDYDGDGYGGASVQRIACTQPEGHVRVGDDCDDGDAQVFPGGTEVCDEQDNDCDGLIDEAVQSVFYPDLDGDGAGDESSPVEACSAPSGYTGETGDCDDSDPAVGPEAVESCNSVDDDCDGEIDEDDAVDATTWFRDRDADAWGDAGLTVVACSAPSGTVAVSGDCDDLDPTASPDRTEVCDEVDNDCDGTVDEDDAADAITFLRDDDGDGYADADTALGVVACTAPANYLEVASGDPVDCDDGDPTVSPAATEVCDGVDNDCDGTIDEDDAADATTWYVDTDGDGHGSAAASTVACSQPAGFSASDDDCDDSAAAALPGGTELCDGLDNDCDGTTDGSAASDALTWYFDYDGDGYGDPSRTTLDCEAPSNHVADDSDCDDTAGSVNPGATESCNGVDDDCDGTTDGASAVDALTFYDDNDGDGYGNATTAARSCSQPTGMVSDKTDCNDRNAAVNPGAAEVCNGIDDDCDSTTTEPTTTWYEDADLDGYGLSSSAVDACAQPDVDWVTIPGDCDDSEDRVSPGLSEVCDGADNNCDGTADENTVACYATADGSEGVSVDSPACSGSRAWISDIALDDADVADRCSTCDYVFDLSLGTPVWIPNDASCNGVELDEFDQLGIQFASSIPVLWGLSSGSWDNLGTATSWDSATGEAEWTLVSADGTSILTSTLTLTLAE